MRLPSQLPLASALLLAPALLSACKRDVFDLSGVWRFQVDVTPAPEDACDQRLLHNLSDALEEEDPGDTGDTGASGWIEEESQESSPWTGYGRFVQDGAHQSLLIAGMLLPQEEGVDAANPSFAWQRSEASHAESSHASGYRFATDVEMAALTRIQVTLPNETQQKDARRSNVPASLTGTWTEDNSNTTSWEESDLWAEELGLGETGQIPFSSYLTRLDELGYVVPASNGRTASDCSDATCVLTVNSSCTQSWTLTATLTEIDPADESWSEYSWESGI